MYHIIYKFQILQYVVALSSFFPFTYLTVSFRRKASHVYQEKKAAVHHSAEKKKKTIYIYTVLKNHTSAHASPAHPHYQP